MDARGAEPLCAGDGHRRRQCRDTRFGMREFRFDTATKRAYLNGHVYFMRGSNITLHRFFEDPKSGTLPWDEAWVRKLLVEIPQADALEQLPLLHRTRCRTNGSTSPTRPAC